MAAEIKMVEGRSSSDISTRTLTEAESKAAQLGLAQAKSEFERFTVEVQTRQAAEAEAAVQLRTDQARVVELQDRLERLDKLLDKLAAPVK